MQKVFTTKLDEENLSSQFQSPQTMSTNSEELFQDQQCTNIQEKGQFNSEDQQVQLIKENIYLIKKRAFKEQKSFIIRTLCLIQFHLLGPLLLCIFCMFKTFIVDLLYDSELQKFQYLFYISVILDGSILFSVTLSRKNARKLPYAQSAYVFFGIFLSFIIAGLYSSTYYSDNQSIAFIILAVINIFQGSNAGALLYFAKIKRKQPIIYSLPFICAFPLLLSLIYMFFMQNEYLKVACWIIALVSILLAILSVHAIYKIIDGAFQLEKDQHCIATIFIYIKMIAVCKDF